MQGQPLSSSIIWLSICPLIYRFKKIIVIPSLLSFLSCYLTKDLRRLLRSTICYKRVYLLFLALPSVLAQGEVKVKSKFLCNVLMLVKAAARVWTLLFSLKMTLYLAGVFMLPYSGYTLEEYLGFNNLEHNMNHNMWFKLFHVVPVLRRSVNSTKSVTQK